MDSDNKSDGYDDNLGMSVVGLGRDFTGSGSQAESKLGWNFRFERVTYSQALRLQ